MFRRRIVALAMQATMAVLLSAMAFAQDVKLPDDLSNLFDKAAKEAAQLPAEKQPVPDAKAREEVFALIQEVYKKEYDEARTNDQKAILAKLMLKVGRESEDDSTGQYVLLGIVRDIATEVGNYHLAANSIREIDDRFEVDVLAMKTESFSKIAKLSRPNDQQKEFALLVLETMDEAVAVDRFDVYKTFGDIALTAARRTRYPHLIQSVSDRISEVGEIEKAYREIEDSLAVLEKTPTDAEANLAIGHYRCFVKNDWDEGMLFLALGSDKNLKELAYMTLENKSDPLVIGDEWWDIADIMDGSRQKNVRQFALRYYREALPKLTGLTKVKIAKRIEEYSEKIDRHKQVAGNVGNAEKEVQAGNPYLGRWRTPSGNVITIQPNGAVENPKSGPGHWVLNDGVLTVEWNSGVIEKVKINPDGKSVETKWMNKDRRTTAWHR